MDRPDYATDEHLEYLAKVRTQYSARRHATVVAFMSQKYGLSLSKAESIVRYWLATLEV